MVALSLARSIGDPLMEAGTLINLGIVFDTQKDYKNAKRYYQQGLGPNHPRVADTLINLADLALEMGDEALAEVHVSSAVSMYEAAEVPADAVAVARFVLARALWREKSERIRARTLAQQARDDAELSDTDLDLAEVEAWLRTHRAP